MGGGEFVNNVNYDFALPPKLGKVGIEGKGVSHTGIHRLPSLFQLGNVSN
jgi:hypothetical protein